MPSTNRHNLVIAPDAWAEVEKRTPPGFGGESETTTTIIRRYVALLAESRMRNRQTFTAAELAFLRAALSDAVTGASIEHALTVYTDNLDVDASGIDLPDLLDRVERLSAVDKMGVVDSIERARIAEAHGKRIIITPQ